MIIYSSPLSFCLQKHGQHSNDQDQNRYIIKPETPKTNNPFLKQYIKDYIIDTHDSKHGSSFLFFVNVLGAG